MAVLHLPPPLSLWLVLGAALAVSGLHVEVKATAATHVDHHHGRTDPPKLYVWENSDAHHGGGPVELNQSSFPWDGAVERGGSSPEQTVLWDWDYHTVSPQAKLAFCRMPKIASHQMTCLFNKINGKEGDDIDYHYSSPARLHIPWASVTKEHGWKFAFLYRDPLKRYLSAYGSKCVVNLHGEVEDDGRLCYGKVQRTPLSMEDMISAFEERAMKDALVGHVANDPHWQTMMTTLRACGLDKFHPEMVDFKGALDENNGNFVVKKMFHATSGYKVGELVDYYFPPNSIRGHSSKALGKVEQFYRNTTVMFAVLKLYEEDYEMLKLPNPWSRWQNPAK